MSGSGNPANGLGECQRLLEFLRRFHDTILLPAGSPLFQEGEPCRGAYYVQDGELSLTITSGERQLTVGEARAGHLLAISSVVSNSDYQFSAFAGRDCKVTFIPSEPLREFLQQNAEVCLFAVQKMGAELLDLSGKVIRPLRLQPRNPRLQ